jgi:hypothetical protein
MNTFTRDIRQTILWESIFAITFGISCFLMGPNAHAASDADCKGNPPQNLDCGTHNMMVVGEKTVFLSHLPMFHSEHRFQVILEATFRRKEETLDHIYTEDRRSHSRVKMYTVSPADRFVLSRLFAPEAQPAIRDTFQGTVFRGHLERGGKPINGMEGTEVHVARVVYAKELRPADAKAEKLEYILFGKGQELFLAHRITQTPDFDQLVAVQVDSQHDFTDAELNRGVIVTVPNRENAAAQRLKPQENVAAEAYISGASQSLPLHLQVGLEHYFEEGELLLPAKFDQTALEEAVGF